MKDLEVKIDVSSFFTWGNPLRHFSAAGAPEFGSNQIKPHGVPSLRLVSVLGERSRTLPRSRQCWPSMKSPIPDGVVLEKPQPSVTERGAQECILL